MPFLKIKKGDLVSVITGKFRGKQGKVERTYPADGMVLVDGVNLVKRHRKPQNQRDPGGIIDMHKPIEASNVMLVCPSTGKLTRIGIRIEDGKKVRFAKKSGVTL
jgi:large subunit ribosomal protein L24